MYGIPWMGSVPDELDQLTRLANEDLIKPTEALISLLYQSVALRDSRHSNQLGDSSKFFFFFWEGFREEHLSN